MSETTRPTPLRAAAMLGALLALATVLALSPMSTPRAEALTMDQRLHVLRVAASREGAPYQYGAAGPWRFDCSGYTMWVFAKIGKRLPHSSAMQSSVVRHVRAADRQRGDLVFFSSGGHVYHVAIYAGLGRIWHAPRSGERVHRERLWTTNVSYGRVR